MEIKLQRGFSTCELVGFEELMIFLPRTPMITNQKFRIP